MPQPIWEIACFIANEWFRSSDRALPGERMARDPNHHRVILALTTAFWDTWLMRDEAARSWLHGNGPKTVMQAADRWQFAAP